MAGYISSTSGGAGASLAFIAVCYFDKVLGNPSTSAFDRKVTVDICGKKRVLTLSLAFRVCHQTEDRDQNGNSDERVHGGGDGDVFQVPGLLVHR